MLKYYLYLFFSIIILIPPLKAAPDTVLIGVDVNSISNIQLKNDVYSIEFQLWLKYTNDSLDIINSISVQKAEVFTKDFIRKERTGDYTWTTAKCNAIVHYEWSLRNFPFVTQDVQLRIVESVLDSKKLVFIADTVNSRLNKKFELSNWKISAFKFYSGTVESGSTYGNPRGEEISFPAGIIHFNLSRESPFLVIEKILTPVWIAFLVALVVFWIKPTNVDPRFGLPAAAMFAAVANKYLISDITLGIPYQIYVETIHNRTFIAILLIIIISVFSLYLCEKGEEKRYKKIDKYSFYIILIAYILENIYELYAAFIQGK